MTGLLFGLEQLMERVFDAFGNSKYGLIIPAHMDSAQVKKQMVRNATSRIYIVAGEVSPDVYDEEMTNYLVAFLDRSRVSRARYLFHKDPSLQIALSLLIKQNPNLARLVSRNWYGDRLDFYWARRRPEYHFMVADDSVLIEELHPPHTPRRVFVKHDAPNEATQLAKFFEAYCSEYSRVERLLPNKNAEHHRARRDLDHALADQ